MKDLFLSPKYIYSAFFRVAVGCVLLVTLFLGDFQTAYLYQSYFSTYFDVSVLNFMREHFLYLLILEGILLVFFIIGFGKYITNVVLFLIYALVLLCTPNYPWGDRIFYYTSLFFVWVNSFQYLSVKSKTFKAFPEWINQLAIISIILNVFVIYITNSRLKWFDSSWLNGTALAYTINSNFFGYIPDWFIELNQYPLISKTLTYIVLIQQTLFVPLVLIKKTRPYIIIFSIMIHVMMMITMGFVKFELIVILHYGFLFSDKDYQKFFSYINNKNLTVPV